MMIVSNGAFKSGSTWVTLIVQQLGTFASVPKEFCDEQWAKDSIRPERMEDFLAKVDLQSTDYMIKAHYKPTDGLREMLLANPHVKILNIYRDPKDVVVSAFFHYCRLSGEEGDFAEFYKQRAERLVRDLTRYHIYWSSLGVEDAIFFTTYEKLHRNFEDEIFRLGAFLERDLTAEKIENIRELTKFSKLKQKNRRSKPSRFFRKGVMGDWQEHMTPEQGARLDEIEADEGIWLVQDAIYY